MIEGLPSGVGNGFTADYRVRFDEAGPDGHIRTSTLLRYAQDVAWRHSEDRGFDREWYAARGLNWVVRGVDLAVLSPIPMGATLAISTAVIGHRRIWARRLAEARQSDGRLVARIETDWVILDRRGRPVRIPPDFGLGFANPELDDDILRVPRVAGDPEWTLTVRVRPHELDPMDHVNNAAYLDWLEEALLAGAVPWAGLDAVPRAARLEYLASAGPGDELVVAGRRAGPSWQAEIRGAAGTVLRASGQLG